MLTEDALIPPLLKYPFLRAITLYHLPLAMLSIFLEAPNIFTLAVGTDQAPLGPFSPILDPGADVPLPLPMKVLSIAVSLAFLPLSVVEILVVVIAAAHPMSLIR